MSEFREGFQIEGTRAAGIARWQERREAKKFDALVTQLRRKLTNRGLCCYCKREVGLVPGAQASVTRYHRVADGPCPGRGQEPVA